MTGTWLEKLLSQGFRPFFLAGATWAAISVGLWVMSVTGILDLRVPDALKWHVHEMLFGYTGAIITGFILTAIPNWTRRLPVNGRALALLVVLWALGRAAGLMQGLMSPPVVMFVDVSFPVCVVIVVLREIIAGKNWKNLPISAALGLYAISNLVDHLAANDTFADAAVGQRMGLSVIVMLIALIGGRVIPSFTGNWLKKRGVDISPTPFSGFDRFSLLVLLGALALWTAKPELALSGWLLMASGTIHGVRMSRWCGYATASDALVIILHVGYGWIALGLLLLGTEVIWSGAVPLSGIHAVTAGGIGTMTLAMMTRASLGHSGQGLLAGPGTIAIYGLVSAGAMLRVLTPMFSGDVYAEILGLSAFLWASAFVLFVVVYFPLLSGVRQSTPTTS